MIYSPNHPKTEAALRQARLMADYFVPVNDAQRTAQLNMLHAVNDGNLYAAVEAIKNSRSVGRRGLATLDWREWADRWLERVDRLIFRELEVEMAA